MSLHFKNVAKRPVFTVVYSVFLIYCYKNPTPVNYFIPLSKLLVLKKLIITISNSPTQYLSFFCTIISFCKTKKNQQFQPDEKLKFLNNLKLLEALKPLYNTFRRKSILFSPVKSDISSAK